MNDLDDDNDNTNTKTAAEPTTRELLARGEHERVSINADGSAVVTLHFPLNSGKETITELTIRRPRAKDLRKMDNSKGGDIGKGLALLVDLSRRAATEIDELDSADVQLCTEVMGFLQQPPRRTGASSSAS